MTQGPQGHANFTHLNGPGDPELLTHTKPHTLKNKRLESSRMLLATGIRDSLPCAPRAQGESWSVRPPGRHPGPRPGGQGGGV